MNTKMKVLSLALVGAFGYVGAASAACPSSPVPPWTSVFENQGAAVIASPGYDSTECRLDSSINAGASFLGAATVTYSQATIEPRFRAQFIVNADTLTGQAFADAVQIFAGQSANGGAVSFNIYSFVGNRTLDYKVRMADGSVQSGTATLPAGEAHVEFDLSTASASGASDGYFKLWIQNSNEAAPTSQKDNLANFGRGIDTVNLGLASPTRDYVAHFGGNKVGFDQFDSRRQTFIGF
ncbi:MAG: hypothetical protein J0H15_10675 [Xanthomonadales bacterium]|nr:hypothetical protein [Xanthomonadales bacterium]